MSHKVEHTKQRVFSKTEIDNGTVGDYKDSIVQEWKSNSDIDDVSFAGNGRTNDNGDLEFVLTSTMKKDTGNGPNFTTENDALANAVANTKAESSASNAKGNQKVIQL